jgi:hypothetical protein
VKVLGPRTGVSNGMGVGIGGIVGIEVDASVAVAIGTEMLVGIIVGIVEIPVASHPPIAKAKARAIRIAFGLIDLTKTATSIQSSNKRVWHRRVRQLYGIHIHCHALEISHLGLVLLQR